MATSEVAGSWKSNGLHRQESSPLLSCCYHVYKIMWSFRLGHFFAAIMQFLYQKDSPLHTSPFMVFTLFCHLILSAACSWALAHHFQLAAFFSSSSAPEEWYNDVFRHPKYMFYWEEKIVWLSIVWIIDHILQRFCDFGIDSNELRRKLARGEEEQADKIREFNEEVQLLVIYS